MAVNNPPRDWLESGRRQFLILLACLLGVMAILFHKALLPDWLIFSNDGPLGAAMAAQSKLPDGFAGVWVDSNWLGAVSPAPAPDLTVSFQWLLGPLLFAKFWAPASLVILGMCAWLFFRELKLAPLACVLGGLAAALHTDPFGNACWGQVSRPLALSASFLALAALQTGSGRHTWIKPLLAGLAVGWGIMESFDVGAIFSLFVAAYVLFQALTSAEGAPAKRVASGSVRLILVSGFAAFIAAQTVAGLVGTQIKGIVGTEQDEQAKAERWDWATQWSIPKVETLGFLIPGVFGYRMDTPQTLPEFLRDAYRGGQYWGTCGQTPGWEQHHQGFPRYGGGGPYSGVLVLAIAMWAMLRSFTRKDLPFTVVQRKFIWFWAGLGFVAVLLAYGRHAPFYSFFYALPYASTIRNPAKFIHVFDWTVMILFAYGVHGLVRCYMEKPAVSSGAKSGSFEKKWLVGSILAVVMSVVGWIIYGASRESLERYLQASTFDAQTAADIANFSIHSVGIFLVLLVVALGLVGLVVRGKFTGRNAKLGGILLGLFLMVDLMRANLPLVVTQNWKEKYVEAGDNPVIAFLRQSPYEHRVSIIPEWLAPAVRASQPLLAAEQMLDQIYRIEWMQHLFLYYNIQSLDIVQMSRVPADIAAFEGALQFDGTPQDVRRISRRWELTNTRYLLGAAGLLNAVELLDPEQHRFKPLMTFECYKDRPDGPILTRTNATGPFALFEFTGALPRAKLYSNWQVSTNDDATLKQLAAKDFDPAKTVLVAENLPPPGPAGATNAIGGAVEFVSYAPKHIMLKAKTPVPAVLLLNDKYDPNWRVLVDGHPAPLLRCNFIMRGVSLTPGAHEMAFDFRPPHQSLYVSLAGVALGLGLCGYLALYSWRQPTPCVQG